MSPYRNPRVLLALALLTAVGIGLILLVNESMEGAARLAGTLAVAVVLWIALMGILRLARRGG